MSGGHRQHSHFSRAKWNKAILWPCWVLQAALLLALTGLFSYRLSHTLSTWQAGQNKAGTPIIELVWESANIGLSLIGFVVVLVSIARLVAEVLTPNSMLFSNLASFLLSGVTLALDVVVYTQRTDQHYSVIGLGLAVALLLLALALAVYSMFVYRRVSKYDDYHLPHNVKSYGYDNHDSMPQSTHPAPTQLYDPTDPSKSDGRVRATSVISNTSRRLSSTSYRDSTPPAPIQPLPDMPRRPSYDHKRDTQFEEYRARRVSGSGSAYRQEVDLTLPSSAELYRRPSYDRQPDAYFEERRARRASGSGNSFRQEVDLDSYPGSEAPRRPSFDHKRDTSFDEYRARRMSGSSAVFKNEVDLALGTEFGWKDERLQDKVLTSGNMNAAHQTTRPRGDSNPNGPQRQSSLVASVAESSTSAGSNITPPSDLSRAHSLVMVPEHPEEHLGAAPVSRNSSYATSRGTARYSEDRERLLEPYGRPVSPLLEPVASPAPVPSPLSVQQRPTPPPGLAPSPLSVQQQPTPTPHRRHPSYGAHERRQSLESQQAQQAQQQGAFVLHHQ